MSVSTRHGRAIEVLRGGSVLVGGHRPTERLVTVVLLAVFTAVMSVAELGPRWLAAAEAASLAEAIVEAPSSARQLSIRMFDDAPPGTVDDPLQLQYRRLGRVADELPGDITRRFAGERIVVDTQRFVVAAEIDVGGSGSAPASPTFLTFRVHPEIAERSRVVAGRSARPTRVEADGRQVFEFELTTESAEVFGWAIGQQFVLTVDTTDPVTRAMSRSIPDDFVAELVGLRELDPESDPYWFGDPRMHRPTVVDTSLGADLYGMAIVHPEQLPSRPFLVDQRGTFVIEYRADLEPSSITVDDSAAVAAGLANVAARFDEQPTLLRPGVQIGIGPVLEAERSQRAAARQTVVVAGVSAFGVVVLLCISLLGVVGDRRRTVRVTARSRGASVPQSIAGSVIEVGSLLVVGFVVGRSSAAAVEPSPAGPTGLWLSAGVAAVSLGCAVAVTWSGGSGAASRRWLRIVAAVQFVVAAAAWVTLRRRGVVADDALDPLVVASPLLLGGAVAVAARGLAPWCASRLSRSGALLRTGALVGARRIGSARAASVGIVTSLVFASTVAALATSTERAITTAAVDGSWLDVGAPFRIDRPSPELVDRLRSTPGLVVATEGRSRVGISLAGTAVTVTVTALDVVESGLITAGTAADRNWPSALGDTELRDRAAAPGPQVVPAVATPRIGGRPIVVGERLGATAIGDLVFEVVEIRSEVAGRSENSVVVDEAVFAAARGTPVVVDTVRFGAEQSAVEAGFRSVLAESPVGVRVVSRSELEARRLEDPLAAAVVTAQRVAAAAAAIAAIGGFAAIALLSARSRRDEVSILWLLGSGRRTIRSALYAELLPSLVTGSVVGIASGWLVVRSFDGRLDLSAFAGDVDVAMRWDLRLVLVVSVATAMAAVGAVWIAARRIEDEAGPGMARFGDGG
ncbi:MAG: hypothetical protein RLZZ01_1880 [Actinomycetota bacterium]